jgi:hypothetical protein
MNKFKSAFLAIVMALSILAAPANAVLRFNEDAAHTTGDQGIQVLTERLDTPASTAGTTGDYAGLVTGGNGALYVQNLGNTAGGLSLYSNLDIDETTGTTTQQMKASAGTLYVCVITNDTAATKEYIKFYDAVSLTGSAAGTETPVITIPLQAASTQQVSFGSIGAAFATGITVAATTGIAVADTGAPAANAVVINCAYK